MNLLPLMVAALACGLLAGLSAEIPAQTTVDPTRPAHHRSKGAPTTQLDEADNPTVSLLLRRNGRWHALIGGQLVQAGSSVGSMKVIEVNADGVMLDTNQGRRRIQFFALGSEGHSGSTAPVQQDRVAPNPDHLKKGVQ